MLLYYIAAKIQSMPFTLRSHMFDNMSNTQVIIFIAVFVVVLLVISHFSQKAVVRRKLKNAPLRGLDGFKDGQVAKIVGVVELVDEPLKAPLSGRTCAWYEVHITQHRNKSTYTVLNEQIKTRFVLRDGNNVAFINTDDIKSHVVEDEKFSSGIFNDATDRLEEYLNSHGQKSEGFLGLNKDMRYYEGVLEENETVAVLGQGYWRNAETVGLPRRYGRVLVITPPANNPVYLSDDYHTVTMHGS